MASWKAWKTKASAWLKRALIITVITIVSLIVIYLVYKISVGIIKKQYRDRIAKLQAELSVPTITSPYASNPYGQNNPYTPSNPYGQNSFQPSPYKPVY